MPGVPPGMPEFGGFADRFKRLESQVDKLNRATRLESSSIGAGGLTVKDLGQIRILDASGNVQVTLDVDGLKVDGGSVLATVPAGNIEATGRSTAPAGWLLCDGAAVSRTTFDDLFAAIGTTYGSGDGSTTFNVPDLRGRFPLGKATSGTGSTLGGTGGAIDHNHTQGNTGSAGGHTHSSDGGHSGHGSAGGHNHGGSTGGPSATVGRAGDGLSTPTQFHDHSISSDGSHSHTTTAGAHTHNTISDHAHTNPDTGAANPPFQVVNYIIKT